ncbi:MAG: O-antigen ligase family protein [Sedimentibacter sp.]|jgi:putative inorganic carbon (HCO3(-)) transporter|nr:O-antigen ligase family protein [Sedimentibacter sp.]
MINTIGITKLQSYEIRNSKLDNVAKVTVILALSVIPAVFVPLGGTTDHFYLPKVAAMIILALSFLAVLAINKIRFKDIVQKDRINISLFIYFILLAASVYAAENKVFAIIGVPGRWEGLVTITLYMFLFITARLYLVPDEGLFKIILVTAIIVSIYGILQTMNFDPFPRDVLRENWSKRAFSTMGNPNFLGSYIVLIIPTSIYFYIIKKNITGLTAYAILFYCLLSTGTRGAWLGTIASIMAFAAIHYMYFRYSKGEFTRYIILLVITILLLALYSFNTEGAFIDRFLSIARDANEFLTKGDRADYSGANRGFIWKRVAELIKKRPLAGYGIENLGEAFKKYYTKDMIELWNEVRYLDKAHNEYLHIAVTSGIPSLLVYLTFISQIILKGLFRLKNCKTALLILSSVIGYMTAAFFNISVVSVAYVYWIFLGLLAGSNGNCYKFNLRA